MTPGDAIYTDKNTSSVFRRGGKRKITKLLNSNHSKGYVAKHRRFVAGDYCKQPHKKAALVTGGTLFPHVVVTFVVVQRSRIVPEHIKGGV